MSEPSLFEDVDKVSMMASLVGSLVSLKWVDPKLPILTRLAMVAGGFATSFFVTPAVAEWLVLKGGVVSALAFGLGIFGMSVIDAVGVWISGGKIGEILDRAKGKVGL